MAEDNVKTFGDIRQIILEEALGLSLPDAVFLVSYFNIRWGKTADSMMPLSVLTSIASQDKIEEWHNKAEALLADAYYMGDAQLRNDANSAHEIAQYQLKHPGFGEKSYSKTISFGSSLAR